MKMKEKVLKTQGEKHFTQRQENYQNLLPASWEIGMQIKKQELESDVEQQTSSRSRKENAKVYFVTLLI